MAGSITIVGLGYGVPGSLSIAAHQALESATRIILRTTIHPGIEDLVEDERVVACDDLYESGDSFESVYEAIVKRVLGFAANEDVVFAVPGSPAFGELTVGLLTSRAAQSGHQVRVVPSVSGLEAVAVVAGIDLLAEQVQIFNAADIAEIVTSEPFSGGQVRIDPTRTVIICLLYDKPTASAVKHALARIFPEDHPVTIIASAGIPQEERQFALRLFELDHQLPDHLTSLIVPPLARLDASRSPLSLHWIVANLRSPDGCPWDRKQTHASLSESVIEEAHEVVDAIASGDAGALIEELGDLLLLVALNAQIAEEEGSFTIEDVYASVNSKLVRRHPHVFRDHVAETPEAVVSTWNAIKAEERRQSDREPASLRYDQLPRSMPVIDRIRRSEGITFSSPAPDDSEIGSRLLLLLDEAFSQGVDPEHALEAAYRTRKTRAGDAYQSQSRGS